MIVKNSVVPYILGYDDRCPCAEKGHITDFVGHEGDQETDNDN